MNAAEVDALFGHAGQGRPAVEQGDDGRLQLAIDEVFGLQNAAAGADHTENLNELPIPETEV
jgi:hypothetical protein